MNQPIVYKFNNFDGPLDLLLGLIEKNRMSVYDINVSEITNQFLASIEGMDSRLESISDFMVMASTLIELKIKMLLPREKDTVTGEEIDPREELVNRLIEYKKIKLMTEQLRGMLDKGQERFFRRPMKEAELKVSDDIDIKDVLKDVSMTSLMDTYLDILKRANERVDERHVGFSKIVRERITVEQGISIIKAKLLTSDGELSFEEIIHDTQGRFSEAVIFLAMLELAKSGVITVSQSDLSSEIRIIPVKENN